MQPLDSSTIFSTVERPVTTLPSMPTSPISFITTATGFPLRPWSSTWRSSVVFPLPRNPVRMSTATVRMASDQRPAGHALGDGLSQAAQQRRRHVVDGHLGQPAGEGRPAPDGREDEYALPV